MWLGHKPLPEFPGRLGDKQPHLMTIPILPSPTRLILTHGLPNLEEACISPLLLPSAVCSGELQESAAGHRHLHAHSDGDLHPDQRGLLHHPPYEFNLGQWRRSSGKCVRLLNTWPHFGSPSAALTPFYFLLPDVCGPGVRCDELDHSLGRGSFLFRRTQRLHPGVLQVSDRNWIFVFQSLYSWDYQHTLTGFSLTAAVLHVFLSLKKAVLRGLQRGPPAWLPVHDPCHPLHSHPRPALQRQSTPIIFYPLILPFGCYVLRI